MSGPLILGTNAVTGGYDVANSCRFNSASSDHLNRSTSSGNRLKWTWSAWLKKTKNGADEDLFSGYDDSSNYTQIQIGDTGRFNYINKTGGSQNGKIETNRVFRDNSAWYHFVIVWDSGNATAGNRMRIYVNGVEETSFANETQPSLNQVSTMNTASKANYIGSLQGTATFFNGYMTEVVLVDGQALDPTSFGEFDEDSPTIWKPKDVSGLTFGTNGFYLDFEDSSSLGNDAAGSNNFTVNNLTAVDQSTDTCTNNFATMSTPTWYDGTIANGGLTVTTNQTTYRYQTSSIGVSSGKWYWEVKLTTRDEYPLMGITDAPSPVNTGTDWILGSGAYDYSVVYNTAGGDGNKYNNAGESPTNTPGAFMGGFSQGDIIMFALDCDNNTLKIGTNNSWSNGTGSTNQTFANTTAISITAPTSTNTGFYFPAVGDYGGAVSTLDLNFGSPSFTISSGNADANGHGNFEYAVPSGYFSLCTKNLAEHG